MSILPDGTFANDIVKINISNSKNDSIAFEVKFSKSITISELKRKLEIITGGNAGTMSLQLFNGDKLVCNIDDNLALLGSLPLKTGMRIHVTDNYQLTFDEPVPKFELSENQYDSKGDTLRHFLKQNRLGKYNEEEMRQREESQRQLAEEEQLKANECTVGSRCEVTVPGQPKRRGTIMYNGPIEDKNGIFIGVRYDEPLGKNNGTLGGKSYFVCPPKYGGFTSPLNVCVGDFPPEDDILDDEI